MRYLKYISLLLLPLVCSCDDERFNEELLKATGDVKYLFMATINEATVESRVAFETEDHTNGAGHFHDLAMHWQKDDKVILSDGTSSYTFIAEEMDVDNNADTPAQIVFAYRGTETIANATAFTGTATYTPTYPSEENYELWQSTNENADHLKAYGPKLVAQLNNVNLTATATDWLASGTFNPIRFTASDDADYAYIKVDLSGFKYPIWGGGTVWVYILDEGTANYDDYQVPQAKLKFGTAPTNMVNIVGVNGTSDNVKTCLWRNLFGHNCRIGNLELKTYQTDALGYFTVDANGEKIVSNQGQLSIKFPNTKTETPFINVEEYYHIDPNNTTGANNYTATVTTNPDAFEPRTLHYKRLDNIGSFYLPIPVQNINAGKYIATVLQCGWSGDLYLWEKKVPENTKFEPGKFYVLDYMNHRPEYAVKFGEATYVRSTYLEQNAKGTDAPRYSLLGKKAILNATADNPNRVAFPTSEGKGMLTGEDVTLMRRNCGGFLANTTQMCSIYPQNNLVRWKMDMTKANEPFVYDDTYNKMILVIYNTDGTQRDVYYNEYILNKVDNYGTDGGFWEKNVFKNTVMTPPDYVAATRSYMQKITKGVIDPKTPHSSGEKHYNCYEYVLNNVYDPVMASTETSNFWRAPYAMDLNTLSKEQECATYFDGDYIVLESISSGHRLCVPKLLYYANSKTTRSKNFDGTNNTGNIGTWILGKSDTNTRLSGGRSVRTFGSTNPAYMQAVLASMETPSHTYFDNTVKLVNLFDIAAPILPVFRWKPESTSHERIILWSDTP